MLPTIYYLKILININYNVMRNKLILILHTLIELGEEPTLLEDSIMNIPLDEKRHMELYLITGDLLEIIDVEKHNNILFRKNFNNDVELQEIVKEFILEVKNKK